MHYGCIKKFIESLGEQYNIREIAFGRWGAVQMVQSQRLWVWTEPSAVVTMQVLRFTMTGAFCLSKNPHLFIETKNICDILLLQG